MLLNTIVDNFCKMHVLPRLAEEHKGKEPFKLIRPVRNVILITFGRSISHSAGSVRRIDIMGYDFWHG
jgi:hypothetical protein